MAIALLAASALLLTRTSGPLALDPPLVGPERAAACAAVLARLPQQLQGAGRRATTPASSLTLAWDTDPPQSVRCGVSGEGLLPADADYDVDGVMWVRETRLRGTPTGRHTWSTTTAPGLELVVADDRERDLINAATDALLARPL